MDTYVYSPLHDERSIRLVQILPGDNSTPVLVTLLHAHITDELSYECLSYAWGKPDLAHTITVVPATSTAEPSLPSSLAVSTNLLEALLSLRGTKLPRLFWIDAICIDQGNVLERGRQVAIMRHIYSAAERVVVWLGSSTPTSGQALRFLDEMAKSMKHKLEHTRHGRRTLWQDWAEGIIHKGGEEHIAYGFPVLYRTPFYEFFFETRNSDWEALDDLLARPWWSRAWVVQEVWCARNRDAVILQCGDNCLSWGQVQLALNYQEAWDDIGNSLRKYVEYRNNAVRLQLWPSLKHRYGLAIHIAGERVKGSPLSSLLWNTWDRDSADPRDKVYAVMHLAGDGNNGDYGKDQISIVPDYTKPMEQLYAEVACEIMRRSENLDYVLLAASNRNDYKGLPSWVPDWRREVNAVRPNLFVNRQKLYSMYHTGSIDQMETWGHGYLAAWDSIPVIEFDKLLRILMVSAFEFDTIMECAEVFLPDRVINAGDIADYIAAAVQMARRPDMLGEETKAADIETVLAAGARSFGSMSNTEIITSILPHRRFFITQGRRMAMGPALAGKGDTLVIIAGCNYPMVLRKCDNGEFRLVGESYVQGVMDGELLGYKREVRPWEEEGGMESWQRLRTEDWLGLVPPEPESKPPPVWKTIKIR